MKLYLTNGREDATRGMVGDKYKVGAVDAVFDGDVVNEEGGEIGEDMRDVAETSWTEFSTDIRAETRTGEDSTVAEAKSSNVNWVVLCVRTGSEDHVVELLKGRLDREVYLPFVPTKDWAYVKKGVVKKKDVLPCFPGYVFIKVCESVESFYHDVHRLALSIEQVYRFLCYGGDKRDIFMRPNERSYIERLLRDGVKMDGSLGFKVGDRVRIVFGALFGLESFIKSVNKSKRTAVVEFPMMGETREFTLMLEIVENV